MASRRRAVREHTRSMGAACDATRRSAPATTLEHPCAFKAKASQKCRPSIGVARPLLFSRCCPTGCKKHAVTRGCRRVSTENKKQQPSWILCTVLSPVQYGTILISNRPKSVLVDQEPPMIGFWISSTLSIAFSLISTFDCFRCSSRGRQVLYEVSVS